MKIFWSREALNRVAEIKAYIAADNTDAAEAFTQKLIALAESLSDNAQRGRIVPELDSESIRELLYKNYRIVYRIFKDTIVIITVFEAHKNLNLNSDRSME